jgi:hypothetical protein
MLGHTLGAAGAIEAITSIMSIRTGTIPPTVNPPHGPVTSPDEPLAASMTPAAAAVAAAPAPSTRVASVAPSAQSGEGFFSMFDFARSRPAVAS